MDLPQLDTERFLADLDALRLIGAFRTGVHRPTFSPQDMEARRWLVDRMQEAGLQPEIDGIGNVLGRHPGPGPKLLVGSHIETQNQAGWLDGALGVVAGVALARAGLPVDAVAFADEEGHYGSFIGSRSFIGLLDEAEIDRLANRYDGTKLRQALADAGLAGQPRLSLQEGRYRGFLEMHIEQGTTLERAHRQVGVVTGIVAIWQYRIVIDGQQDHAGGTTMAERRDAGLAAVRLLSWIDAEFPRHCGERTVWTAGRIALEPGAPSIIPGRAEILFQIRDLSTDMLERLDGMLRRAVQESNRRERCTATLEVMGQSTPALCDAELQDALADAAEALAPGGWQRMPSGAGHDAQYLTRRMPVAMLFVPSIGGISHHWAEDTKREDLAMGLRVLASGARRALATLCLLLGVATAGQAASPPAVEAAHGMVVTSQRLASEAGVDMLRRGGNAVDAAVAVGYALAVVNPCCGNIGGGGFMTLHLADGRDRFLDFREMAPAAATADMYLDGQGKVRAEASLYGSRAAGVPGTVAGLEAALAHYGTLPRTDVMAPAIRLARDGFVLTRGDTDILDAKASRFRREPGVAKIFLRPDGGAFQPGDRLVQTDLAATLAAISAGGADAFYHGHIPQAVEAAAKLDGGVLTAADFAAYHIEETDPIRCSYRGAVVLSAPPPSSGGTTLCEILDVLEGYDMTALGFHSAQSVHLMVEAMRHAYLDRNTFLGDPAFVDNPLERLLSKDYAAEIRSKITDRATPSKDVLPGAPPHEKLETTHYSIVDKDGNAVSVTYTINGSFGAVAIAGDTGFLLNNEMDDFTVKLGAPNLYGLVQGQANAIAPGKRPLSSMAPTIVTRDGHTLLVTGSPGGSRIITITLETILNVVDFGMAPEEAVDAPRIHHQWLPDVLYAEPFALSPDTQALLRGMGYAITEQVPWGAAEMVAVGPEMPSANTPAAPANDAALSGRMRPGLLYGANDDRRPAGAASGY